MGRLDSLFGPRLKESFEFNHPDVGLIRVNVRRGVKNFSIRRRNEKVYITAPYGVPLAESEKIFDQLIKRLQEKLARCHNLAGPQYVPGTIFDLGDLLITIEQQSRRPDLIGAMRVTIDGRPAIRISIGSQLNHTDIDVRTHISDQLCRMVRRNANSLIDLGRAEAARVGARPKGWRIGYGRHTLGTCRRDGTITLSYLILFLPPHLRRYIICHELAHLQEMNHSLRFHLLCDRYCGGLEKQYIVQLRAYAWPIIR